MPKKLKHESRIFLLTLLAGTPALTVALWFLWRGDSALAIKSAVTGVLLLLAWALSWSVRERVMRPLQTASNLLSALREEDFSVRARASRKDDALGELFGEVNALSHLLRDQRLGAVEASALVRTVLTELEVAVLTFDESHRLRFANRAAERLLARPQEQLLGRTAEELSVGDLAGGEGNRTFERAFPGGTGRWGLRRSVFRQEGRPHQLIVLTDLSRALREEERQAWQRIVRVIGHELNNSLAPIKSIAGTMGTLLAKNPRPLDWESDLQGGLGVIAARADSLSRFMEAYGRLARLPNPQMREVSLASCVRRAAALETRLSVTVTPGPEITLRADGDQLEQALINLLRNAADATMESEEEGRVQVTWSVFRDAVELTIEDNGPGLANSGNLFVPFFTTKPGGSGIGLVLSRQISEAHGGSLSLENRQGGRGCVARLRLPLR